MQFQCGEVDRVDENIAGVAQIGDRGRKESLGREDGVIIPAFDPEGLQEFQPVEIGIFQIAIQVLLFGPADVRQAPIRV